MRHTQFLAVSLVAGVAAAQPTFQVADLIARNSYPFSYTETALTGAGAEFMRAQMARSQFVLVGEDHLDHATPIFAGALFRMLHDVYGFRYLVVEQDPIATEEALKPGVAGNVDHIADLARRWPSLFEFDTDEDLALLARVGSLTDRDDAIWGVEQATGAVHYLEELVTLAPNESARARAGIAGGGESRRSGTPILGELAGSRNDPGRPRRPCRGISDQPGLACRTVVVATGGVIGNIRVLPARRGRRIRRPVQQHRSRGGPEEEFP